MNKLPYRAGSARLVKDSNELLDRYNEDLRDGISFDKRVGGDILFISLAPNETKTIPHGLRNTPLYRIILRQTGNGLVTDVDSLWTESTIGLKNESANTVDLVIKLLLG